MGQSSVSKRIRDVERLIKKKGSSDELIFKLEQLQKESQVNHLKVKEKANSTKYHMVKFVERKKVTRNIQAIDIKIKTITDKKSLLSLNKEREILIEDLTYIMYYPKSIKYISCTKSDNDDKNTLTLRSKAKQQALEARKHDIDTNSNDRVQHAIEVAINGKTSSKKHSKKGKDNDNDNDESNDDDSYDNENDHENSDNNDDDNDKDDDDNDNDDDDDDDDDNDKKINTQKKEIIKPKTTSNRNSNSSDINTTAIDPAMKDNSSSKNVNNDENKSGGKKSKKYDSFFLEEAELADDDDDVDMVALDPNNDRNWNPKSVNRKTFKRTTDKFANVDTSKLSKQELRLVKWQQDRRGKNSVLLGKDNRQNDRGNNRDNSNKYSNDDNKKSFGRDARNNDGGYRQKVDRSHNSNNTGDNGGGYRQKVDRSHNSNRSGDYKNEGFKRKIEGSIIESKAKKIKFED